MLLSFGGLGTSVAYYSFYFKPRLLRTLVLDKPKSTETVSAELALEEVWSRRISAIGSVSPVQGVYLAAQVDGVVRAIHFDSGQSVRGGSKLLELDDTVEQADLRSIEANLLNAETTLQRETKTLSKGVVSQSDFDAAMLKRNILLATADRLRAQIAKKTISTPWSGQIGLRTVDVGQFIAAGKPIVWIQSLDPIYADFPVGEGEVRLIQSGMIVEASAAGFPKHLFVGSIIAFDAKVSQANRTLTARAKFENREQKLLPGLSVKISVITAASQRVVTVPRTAISYSQQGPSVFIVAPSRESAELEPALRVSLRLVSLGQVRGDRIEIAAGLRPGEQVVTAGQNKLQSGSRIIINNSTPLIHTEDAERE